MNADERQEALIAAHRAMQEALAVMTLAIQGLVSAYETELRESDAARMRDALGGGA